MHGPASAFTPMAHHAGKASASNIVAGPYGITSMGKSLPSRETSGGKVFFFEGPFLVPPPPPRLPPPVRHQVRPAGPFAFCLRHHQHGHGHNAAATSEWAFEGFSPRLSNRLPCSQAK